MRINEINRKKARERWGRIHAEEERLIRKNKKGNEHLKARIYGYLCGDGSVSMREEKGRPGMIHADIYFYPDHKLLIRPFTEAFYQIYRKRLTLRNLGTYYSLRLVSMTAAKDILADGRMTSMEWRVPDWIRESKRNSREWLRAFFDCEAYVCTWDLRIQSVNRQGLRQVAEMLKKFGITSKEYIYQRKNKNWNTNYHLSVGGRENRKAFLNLIGFNHVDKLGKLIVCRGGRTR